MLTQPETRHRLKANSALLIRREQRLAVVTQRKLPRSEPKWKLNRTLFSTAVNDGNCTAEQRSDTHSQTDEGRSALTTSNDDAKTDRPRKRLYTLTLMWQPQGDSWRANTILHEPRWLLCSCCSFRGRQTPLLQLATEKSSGSLHRLRQSPVSCSPFSLVRTQTPLHLSRWCRNCLFSRTALAWHVSSRLVLPLVHSLRWPAHAEPCLNLYRAIELACEAWGRNARC